MTGARSFVRIGVEVTTLTILALIAANGIRRQRLDLRCGLARRKAFRWPKCESSARTLFPWMKLRMLHETASSLELAARQRQRGQLTKLRSRKAPP